VILLAVMLKSCLALITDELLNNSSDKLIFYGYDVNEKVVKSDYVMDQTLVLEQDEQVSTLASNPAFISALKDININLSDELFNSSSSHYLCHDLCH
jgi:hypothetical protein